MLPSPFLNRLGKTWEQVRQHHDLKRRASSVWRHTKSIVDNTSYIRASDFLLVAMFRDEKFRLVPFIEYYRRLGIDHFIFIDNDSSDGGLDPSLCEISKDISLFRVTQSFGAARQGTDWLNAFLQRYCCGHWVLSVDVDEFFVFPHMERRTLRDLVSHLTDAEQAAVWSLMLDMYPNGPIEEITFNKDTQPVVQADHFDPNTYFMVAGGYQDVWVRGGPRLRRFFKEHPEKAPALNKVPLIKWKKNFNYLVNQHVVSPLHLNSPHCWHSHVTGALLHFKFDSRFSAKAKEESRRGQHYQGGEEYKRYSDYYKSSTKLDLMYASSTRFESSKTLLDLGLINDGLWS